MLYEKHYHQIKLVEQDLFIHTRMKLSQPLQFKASNHDG